MSGGRLAAARKMAAPMGSNGIRRRIGNRNIRFPHVS
jgi:hypothetical protein